MSYVWTPEQIARYRRYYDHIRTHHSSAYVRFATTKEFARSVLPPCLSPSPSPCITIGFSAFMEWIEGVPNRDGRDRAMILGINAAYGEAEGSYYLTVVETEEMNIVTGRELWGMPKKMGVIDMFEEGERFHGFASRKGFDLIELTASLGDPAPSVPVEETEYYFDLRGYFSVNGESVSEPQLVIFNNVTRSKRLRSITSATVTVADSPLDPGIGTIPLGRFLDGAYLGGETTWHIDKVVELKNDGQNYAPYLMGRLYDDWPDVRAPR